VRLVAHNLYTFGDDGFEVLNGDLGMKLFPIRTHRNLDNGPFGMSTFLGELVNSWIFSVLVELENEVAEPVPISLELLPPVEPNSQLLVLCLLWPSVGAISRAANVTSDTLKEIL
jgi:hypothetical protein